MSVEAPWLALACDWHESAMFAGTTAGQKLAWVAMMCFSKSRGRAGRFTLRASVMCHDFTLDADDLSRMLAIAEEHGAITFDGSVVQFTNWAVYQDPAKRRANLVKRNGFSKSSTTGPRTKDQGPGPGPGPVKNGAIAKDDIEDIYRLYPRKVGKRTALKAIGAAVNRVADEGTPDPVGYLRAAVTAYAASPAGQPPPSDGTDYRPHPATWFNQGRFDDDRQEWNKPNGIDSKPAEDHPGRIRAPAGKYDRFDAPG